MDTHTKRTAGAMNEIMRRIGDAGEDPGNTASPCKHYRIEPGDTLMTIAEREYGSAHDWRRIFEANTDLISDPSNLPTGQRIRIPF